jgi:S-methylmethionine-dependent homocysteine/selenocysteine methylase
MSNYRNLLPQIGADLFLTDAGLETTLIFHEGLDLPCFAAFDLLKDDAGMQTLKKYYRRHANIARQMGTGFILESATWRASPDWGARLGYSSEALDESNRKSIAMLHELRTKLETKQSTMIISGNVGPRGDGYNPATIMTPAEAEAYHARQIRIFAGQDADLVTAATMTSSNEAIGVTRAAKAANIPVVISFTVETDGRLPTGETLQQAIRSVDEATQNAPAYFMINCAHPAHFGHVLSAAGDWGTRIKGLRANASRCSHAELDEATELDDGDPVELGRQYRELLRRMPHITVLGGCCGTDHRHIEQIAKACLAGE